MTAVVAALFAIALALAAVSLLVPVAERLRIPHTVLLAVLGMLLGVAATRVDLAAGASPMGDAFDGLRALVLSPETFLYVFLPPLLFTAGLMIDVRRLFDEISAVLLLAIVAVFVCIGVVGGLVHLATGVDIHVCLLLGAIVSTTDPAAVIGILRDVGAPKRLSILAEGEALFNDAAAITAFVILIDILGGRALGSAASPVFIFLREFLGGLALGFVLAQGALMILSRLGASSVAVVSVTVSLAYLAYIVGDKYIHVSGVVAVVAAALTLAAAGPTRLQPRQWEALQHSWHQLEFWASSMIFLLASMVAVNLLAGVTKSHMLGLAALYFAAFGARALVLFGLLPALEALGRVQPVDNRYKTMIVWGGLRGAVTLALALVAYANPRLPQEARDFVAILATLFVIATLFVNAPSLRPLMRFFRLNELDATDAALRERVLRLSRATVAGQVHEVADAYGVGPTSRAACRISRRRSAPPATTSRCRSTSASPTPCAPCARASASSTWSSSSTRPSRAAWSAGSSSAPSGSSTGCGPRAPPATRWRCARSPSTAAPSRSRCGCTGRSAGRARWPTGSPTASRRC
ncbi:MAG: sodium:proton antiporter [Rhodospirillales bacterium]|nr:MAG: sodium:proton antiporter [Rhodospirillales bacterium]